MTYNEALEFIHSRNLFAKKAGLDGITHLLNLMGRPQDSLKIIHVAGTNGKGSTTTMIASALMAAGYKTGKFISPYIIDFRERIQINNEFISEDTLAELTALVKGFCVQVEASGTAPTEFEVITAIALEYYKRSGCDYVVLEVGLGGRFDPTNVVNTPLVSVITSIGFDHEAILGNTLTAIAGEKAGILKPGGIAVCYPDQPTEALAEIMRHAAMQNNPFIMGGKSAITVHKSDMLGTNLTYGGLTLTVPLVGEHQIYNSITAIEALFALRRDRGVLIPDDAIINGIASARFPARFEVLQSEPVIIIDGAHNPSGVEMLARSLALLEGRGIVAIIGASRGKNITDTLGAVLCKCKAVICTAASFDRKAVPAHELLELILPSFPDAKASLTREEALQMALRSMQGDDALLIFGSLYLASDMRGILLARQG